MINLQAKDQCPQYVYKYCTQEVYKKHISHGVFKLGSLAEYRRAYELDGAGFGDCSGQLQKANLFSLISKVFDRFPNAKCDVYRNIHFCHFSSLWIAQI